MIRPALLAVALVTGCGQAWAGGDGFIRDLTGTTAGACAGGNLKEHYFESGNVHGDSEEVEIACLIKPDHAAWIMIAGTHCYGIKVCPHRRMQRPSFATPPGHYVDGQPEGEGSPKTMVYSFRRYAIGHECDLKSYKTDYEDKNLYWAFAQYEAPFSDQPTMIRTSGGTSQLRDVDDTAPQLPFQTTLPDTAFDIDEAQAIIDPE